MDNKRRVAVIGGGIFGVTSAILLSKAGYDVTLYEKEHKILSHASGINQFRVHRGYHYPRSEDTLKSCLLGERKFSEFFSLAVMRSKHEHYYCVSKKSVVSAEYIRQVYEDNGLHYSVFPSGVVKKDSIESIFYVFENLYDPVLLESLCASWLRNSVKVVLGVQADLSILDQYDLVVVATYDRINDFCETKRKYQFEVVEKLVLQMPSIYNNISVVIIDGDFMCIDPYGYSEFHLMGNVVHAIHQSCIGELINIKSDLLPYVNKGIIVNPPITNFDKFIDSAKEYFWGVEMCRHVGSMFTVRCVLPGHEFDDARPTLVERVNNKVITVFGGKIPTCIDAAEQVVKLADSL